MSYMESLIDKPAIVIDIGHAYTKCGFAGELAPHSIIPTRIFQNAVLLTSSTTSSKEDPGTSVYDYKQKRRNRQNNKTVSSTKQTETRPEEMKTGEKKKDKEEEEEEEQKEKQEAVAISVEENDTKCLKEILDEFLYRIYYKTLNANSRERKVVIVESVFATEHFRNTLVNVLFKNFQAVSVAFVCSHAAALYTLGIFTALVVDCGHSDVQLLPLAEGMPLVGLTNFIALGAQRLHSHIRELLGKYANVRVGSETRRLSGEELAKISDDTIEDIKVRCCFVTSFARSRRIYAELDANSNGKDGDGIAKTIDEVSEFEFVPSIDYNLANNVILTVPGFVRETALEILFVDRNEDDGSSTIPHVMLDALARCPVDLKTEMSENIVLMGGTCMLVGFKDRLALELNHLLKDWQELPHKKLAFHEPPSHENYTAWLGGAIFGSLDTLDMSSLSLSKYKEEEKLADWFCVTANRHSNLSHKTEMAHI